ncbi:MAG: hypothetical protein ABI550_00040 [Ignavibacteriaceae bacterium]
MKENNSPNFKKQSEEPVNSSNLVEIKINQFKKKGKNRIFRLKLKSEIEFLNNEIDKLLKEFWG